MYYKVVFNDNGIYRSILAGNTKIDEYSELCILPSIKYKVGEYVEHDSPLLVFRSLNDAKKFVRHECLTSFPYKIFSCEIVLSTKIIKHMCMRNWPDGTVFADKVKLLWEVDNEVL